MADGENKLVEEPKPVETIKIVVDDREIEVPKTMPDPMTGNPIPTTMIQACKQAGVDVPHYCYHEKLPVSGNCRMCLVEFGMPAMGRDRKPVLDDDGNFIINKMTLPYEPGTPRGAISCATPIAPGMEIYPNSEATKDMRKGVMESLLINHPLDCPICDQAGECTLQEHSVEHGNSESQFVENKVTKPKKVDLGPRIMLDDERCVLCTRCIRFTKDIVGDDALGIVNRGSYNSISAFPGSPFDNDYTLNTVDLCPVGALTSKDFRFKMRVWFMKESKSICNSCGTGCNITVGEREGDVLRFVPRGNDAVNSEWMCDHGRLNYKWVQDQNRLADPMVKHHEEKLELTDWETATNAVSQVVQGLKKGESVIIGSAGLTNEELYLLSRLGDQLNAITDSVPHEQKGDDFLISKDKNPNSNGARITGISGKKLGGRLKKIQDDVKSGKIKVLIVFGEDLMELGFDKEHLNKLKTLVVCDVKKTATTELADILLPGAAWLEKRGSFTNGKGRVQKFMKAVEAPGAARAEWEILHDIVLNVTGQNGFKSIEGLFNQMAADVKPLNGVTWRDVGHLGVDIEI
ncbi:molybdopterin-dependent oxidoreductase [Verrucomicrobia bacterium]|nr:molybdopterin-dependent oxidoreductase [Verrucomicrobiota bacterium]